MGRVVNSLRVDDLERDGFFEPGVPREPGQVHLGHPTLAQRRNDDVPPDATPRLERARVRAPLL